MDAGSQSLSMRTNRKNPDQRQACVRRHEANREKRQELARLRHEANFKKSAELKHPDKLANKVGLKGKGSFTLVPYR